MIGSLPPGALLIVGAVLIPLLPHRLCGAYMLALPAASLAATFMTATGTYGEFQVFSYELVPVRVDKLAIVFGVIFHIAAFLTAIYALHIRDRLQQTAAMIYVGSAIGAVFAGDLVTLFVYWEITAISSVFLIWARRTERAYRAGMRYLIIQVGSGVLLASGAVIIGARTGSLAFDKMGLDGAGGALIFLAFGIKAAFPLLHNWLQDSYPESTVTGTVFLSAFTTKLAIYALARGFPGTEILIPIGALMTAFPIFYAVIENDLRRVLAYSLNNQLGFMVVGIGVGTEAGINGAVGHAFAHILYKALLFMSMGAVLHRVGTIKGSELGGLYKSMPWTTGFCIVGAASISAFPLFSGFVTKSIILAAAAEEGYMITFVVLLFASAGVFHHSGIKIPYFAFFAHDRGIRVREAPTNMLIAMGITAALSIGIGVYPAPLFALLPYHVEFVPYTTTHVITQLQLLLCSALAFGTLQVTGIYPPELRSTNLDSDWSYRRLLPAIADGLMRAGGRLRAGLVGFGERRLQALLATVFTYYGPRSHLARTWETGSTVLLVAAALSVFLLLFFL